MRTASTNKKVREIINLVKDGGLVPKPEFQRRLVWSQSDKNHYLDSILRGYPFPEIYLADGEVDTDTGRGTQLLVDGLQRVSTLIQYFDGDESLKLTTVPSYRSLSEIDRVSFLQYDVAVRDLGSISRQEIVEVFKRLNATKYSLSDIEVNNALYAGELKKFAEEFAKQPIFEINKVFNALDYKRMGDLRFTLGVICSMMSGYLNRDDGFESFLSRYNDDFPMAEDISARITGVISYLEECGFPGSLRIWKKADLYTALVELDANFRAGLDIPSPLDAVKRLTDFYKSVDSLGEGADVITSIYYKAALQASNDRTNRVRRGVIFSGKIMGLKSEKISENLIDAGILDTIELPFVLDL